MDLVYDRGGEPVTLRVDRAGGGFTIKIGERTFAIDHAEAKDGWLSFRMDGRSISAAYARVPEGLHLWVDGTHHVVRAPLEEEGGWGASSGGAFDGRVLTPMPGKVVAVNVSTGDRVEAGQPLVVLESMKMQNDISAPSGGVVTAVHHEVGDNVEYGDSLVEVDVDDDAG